MKQMIHIQLVLLTLLLFQFSGVKACNMGSNCCCKSTKVCCEQATNHTKRYEAKTVVFKDRTALKGCPQKKSDGKGECPCGKQLRTESAAACLNGVVPFYMGALNNHNQAPHDGCKILTHEFSVGIWHPPQVFFFQAPASGKTAIKLG
jgi:hypothetical protein